MLKTCSNCLKIHDSKVVCKSKQYYKKTTKDNKDVNYIKIIKSKRWQKVSSLVKSLDCYNCLVCLDCDIRQPQNLEVHHITKVLDDISKAYDVDNLITLCIYHHKQADNNKISKKDLQDLISKYRLSDYDLIN